MSSKRPVWGAASGYSVVELSLALLISTLALALAADLLLESQRRGLIENQRALDPSVPIALKQLRADITAAADVGAQGTALVLSLPSMPPIRWEVISGQLVRTVGDRLPENERLVLDGVRRFRWRKLAGSASPAADGEKLLVRVEIEYLAVRGSGRKNVDGKWAWVPREGRHQTLVLTLRGGGGVGW